jgi:hypothetical protein
VFLDFVPGCTGRLAWKNQAQDFPNAILRDGVPIAAGAVLYAVGVQLDNQFWRRLVIAAISPKNALAIVGIFRIDAA